MALFNYATKEITLKIVYYGPGLSGKTTNLQNLHSILDPTKTGKLLSLATEADRTLFFDFLPVDLGKIKDFSIRFQLYTVPGQVKYNATRKIVLKGADAVVFVADSQRDMRDANIESFANMKENLLSNNINPDDIPIVLQYNKRDLPDILSISELNSDLNNSDQVYLEAEAINGKGVQETFQTITKLLIKDMSKKHKLEIKPATPREETVAAEPKEHEEGPVIEEEIPIEEPASPVIAIEEPVIEAEEIQSEAKGLSVEMELSPSDFQELVIEEEKPELEKLPKPAVTPQEVIIEEKGITLEKPVLEEKEMAMEEIGYAEEVPVSTPMERLNKIEDSLKEINQLFVGFIEKEEKEKAMRKEPEIPKFPVETLNKISESLKEANQLLTGIKAAIKELQDDLKTAKEERKEILSIVREMKIHEAVERIKEKGKGKKGGWFGMK